MNFRSCHSRCCCYPKVLAAGVFFLWLGLLAAPGMSATAYDEWSQPFDRCAYIWQEREMRQGLASDWQMQDSCRREDWWWVPELKPRMKRAWYKGSASDAADVDFAFEEDFASRFGRLMQAEHAGPPKWMPPELAYWDTAIGDWRYLRNHNHMDIYNELGQPEMLMLWVKYESFEEGVVFDAAMDFSQLAELFDLTRFRLGAVATKLLKLLGAGD